METNIHYGRKLVCNKLEIIENMAQADRFAIVFHERVPRIDKLQGFVFCYVFPSRHWSLDMGVISTCSTTVTYPHTSYLFLLQDICHVEPSTW